MDKTNFINKLKAMFSEVEAEEVVKDVPAEEEFKDISTEDGVVLRTSEAGLVEGEKLLIVSVGEDEAETVADSPEAEYTVEGKVVVVGADGVIVSVVDAEEEAPKEEEAVVEEEMSEVPKWAVELTARLEALETSNSNMAESMSAIDKLSETVSKIANEPADEEIKLSKSATAKSNRTKTKEDKLNFFSKK